MEALFAFCEDGDERLREIKKCLKAGDLSLYVTHVHGIKSAARFIGADSLSETAAALEDAGENNNLVFIETHNANFLLELETLLSNISDYVSKA
jgi:HPt (histidine-containing phosphotransfer) domain-containing protein